MKQQWVLQGFTESYGEWVDLATARRIKSLPKINPKIAKSIGAKYRVVLRTTPSRVAPRIVIHGE